MLERQGSLLYYSSMLKFRFVTPHRQGKWYPDLSLAQRFANAIGAGFLEPRSGRFYAYAGTRLEVSEERGGGAQRPLPR